MWDYIEDENRMESAHPFKTEIVRDPFMQNVIDVHPEEETSRRKWKRFRRRMKRRIRKNYLYFQLLSVAGSAMAIILLSFYFFVIKTHYSVDLADEARYADKLTSDSLELDRIIDSLAALTPTHKAVNTTSGLIREVKPSHPIAELVGSEKPPIQQEKIKKDEAKDQNTDYSNQSGKPPIQQEKIKKDEAKDQNTDYSDRSGKKSNNYSVSGKEVQEIFSKLVTNDNQGNQTPKPVGGDKSYSDYIKNNQTTITDDAGSTTHGKVILLFKVNEKGRPVDISILRALNQAADREAIRLLQNGPNWTVGSKNALLEVEF